MEDFPINIADGIVVVVLLGAGLIAFASGFIKVLLSIVSGVGAILVTFHLFPLVNFIARQHIELKLVADGLTLVSIFIVALVIFSMIGQFISRRVHETGMGFLDRTLGFVFGLACGAAAVSVSYLVLVWLVDPKDHPDWVREARVLPLVKYGAKRIEQLAPEKTLAEMEAGLEEGGRKLLDPITFQEVLRQLFEPGPSEPAAEPPDSDSETGYKTGERKQLERLIETQEAN